MRIPLVLVAAIAVLQVPGWAEAADRINPGGGGYVDTNRGKIGKDYYVVQGGKSNECSVVHGDFGKAPSGAIGGAPYASKKYAEAALKKLSECKGGEATEFEGKKHGKK